MSRGGFVDQYSEICKTSMRRSTWIWIRIKVKRRIQIRSQVTVGSDSALKVLQILNPGVSQQRAAQLRRVKRSSERCSLAQKGAAQLLGCSVAQKGYSVAQQGAAQLRRVQRSSIGCSVAQESAAQLKRVQRSSQGCSVAQKGATSGARGGECYISKPRWSCWKIFDSGCPSLGLKEALVSGNSKHKFFGR